MKSEFDWNTVPLPEAKRRLAELEKLVNDARTKVSAREQKEPKVLKVYKCWSQSHSKEVPESVMKQCKGDLRDGSEIYRDDSAKNDEGMIVPIRVCSYLCFRVFQDYANKLKIERNKR